MALLKQFERVVDETLRKPYNGLDFKKTDFDGDLLEINVQVNDLELALLVSVLCTVIIYINESIIIFYDSISLL